MQMQSVRYMERGGVVAWGIVPADYKLFIGETVDSLYARYLRDTHPAYKAVTGRTFRCTVADHPELRDPVCGPERCSGDPAGRSRDIPEDPG